MGSFEDWKCCKVGREGNNGAIELVLGTKLVGKEWVSFYLESKERSLYHGRNERQVHRIQRSGFMTRNLSVFPEEHKSPVRHLFSGTTQILQLQPNIIPEGVLSAIHNKSA